MSERRTETRRVRFCTAEVRLMEPDGPAKIIQATVEDVSERGMGFRVRQPLEVGSTVEIQAGQKKEMAEVRRCLRIKFEYLVGVRFCSSAATTES